MVKWRLCDVLKHVVFFDITYVMVGDDPSSVVPLCDAERDGGGGHESLIKNHCSGASGSMPRPGGMFGVFPDHVAPGRSSDYFFGPVTTTMSALWALFNPNQTSRQKNKPKTDRYKPKIESNELIEVDGESAVLAEVM